MPLTQAIIDNRDGESGFVNSSGRKQPQVLRLWRHDMQACPLSPPPWGSLKRVRQTVTKNKRKSRRIDNPSHVRHGKRFRRSKAMTDTPQRDPMQDFADRIIAELENGVKPWVRPWDPEKAGGPQAPFNPVTGKRYHGVNFLILGMDMRAFQTGDPRSFLEGVRMYMGAHSVTVIHIDGKSDKALLHDLADSLGTQ